MTDDPGSEGFAPSDYTDDRARFEWKSGYPSEAKRHINIEAAYSAFFIFSPTIFIYGILISNYTQMFILHNNAESIPVLIIAWLGGTLGGAVFATKWLYHVVGKGRWHLDRRLWRFLTPHISGAVAFSFVALASSEVLPIFSFNDGQSIFALIGISFLLGYFSDTAVAKLNEIASVVFGTVKDREPSEPKEKEGNQPESGNDANEISEK